MIFTLNELCPDLVEQLIDKKGNTMSRVVFHKLPFHLSTSTSSFLIRTVVKSSYFAQSEADNIHVKLKTVSTM